MIDIDIERTRIYYNSLSQSMLCDCDYCRLYYAKAVSSFPALADWLDSYGIDISKPFEVSSIGPDENGVVEYIGVQYIAFGTCSKVFHNNIEGIEIRIASSYPGTDIKELHFVLEAFPMSLILES